ncbi:hypothetical protein IWX49DRAFT_591561 [Phyllosticta citricarpa]|uniref:Serine-rich protein n=1 Tax=Phyllosticta citricarpa TaxID=55181 RepID=A0ABR1MG24_9PEZI
MSSRPDADVRPSSPSSPHDARPTSPRQPRRQNQLHAATGPTIRVVEDPGSPTQDKPRAPAPGTPSQAPSQDPAQGSRVADRDSVVSDDTRSTNSRAASRASSFVRQMVSNYETRSKETLAPLPRQTSQSNRASTSTHNSDADTLNTLTSAFSPTASTRFSQATTPPTSPIPFSDRKHDSFGSLGVAHDDTRNVGPTIRPIVTSTSSASGSHAPSLEPAPELTERGSHPSLVSSDSSAPTVTYHDQDPDTSWATSFTEHTSADRPPTRGKDSESRKSSWASLNVAPHERPPSRGNDHSPERPPTRGSNSIRSGQTGQTILRKKSSAQLRSPARKESEQSLAQSDDVDDTVIHHSRPDSSPVSPTHDSRHDEDEDDTVIHEPFSGPGSERFQRPYRMTTHSGYYRWSPPLSTIESASEPRTGSVASTLALSGASQSHRRQTLGSYGSSQMGPSSGQSNGLPSTPSEPSAGQRPQFTPKNGVLPEARPDSSEGADTVPELNQHNLRPSRSGMLSRNSSDGRPDTALSERSSYTSLFLNSLPSWARFYYRNGDRTSFGTVSDSTSSSASRHSRSGTMQSGASRSPTESTFPVNPIWSPRQRPLKNQRSKASHLRNISSSQDSGINTIPPRSRDRQGSVSRRSMDEFNAGASARPETYVPHLRKDRRSATLSIWTVPSIDTAFGHLFTGRGQKSNKFILMFCLGFIMPLTWVIGAFLPVGPRPGEEFDPQSRVERGKEQEVTTDVEGDLQWSDRDLEMEERKWRKAIWWRRVNRCFAVLGIAVIAAVVAVALTAEL